MKKKHLIDKMRSRPLPVLCNRRSRFLRPTLFCLAITVVFLMPRSLASTSHQYCITPIDLPEQRDRPPRQYEPVQLPFEVDGVSYKILEDNYDAEEGDDRLFLVREAGAEHTRRIIQLIRVPQRVGNVIEVALGRDGLLWINGQTHDYTAYLSTDGDMPRIENVTQLPELYSGPCSILDQLWDGCMYRLVGGDYSKSLNRIFTTGYPASFFGLARLQALEIVSGEVRQLPRKLHNQFRIVADVDTINPKGVILRNSHRKLLYYDGKVVHQLASDLSDYWYAEITDRGRVFLRHTIHVQASPLLRELKAGPELVSIQLPHDFPNGWIELFQTSSDDTTLWGITRNGFYIEEEGLLKRIFEVREDYYIEGPAGIEQSQQDGSIFFTLKNELDDSSTRYSIQHDSTCAGNPDYDGLLFLE